MLLLNNNNFNEASKTLRYVTLVGSKKDLKELSVIIVSVSAAADLPNGTIITQFNEYPLIQGEGISLISTAKAKERSIKQTW